MSNLKTREFWVSDSNMWLMRDDNYVMIHRALYNQLAHSTDHRLTISWEEKPKNITISEDEFNDLKNRIIQLQRLVEDMK